MEQGVGQLINKLQNFTGFGVYVNIFIFNESKLNIFGFLDNCLCKARILKTSAENLLVK